MYPLFKTLLWQSQSPDVCVSYSDFETKQNAGYYAEAHSLIQATFSLSTQTICAPSLLLTVRTGLRQFGRLFWAAATFFSHSLTGWRKWQRREDRVWQKAEETRAEWQDASDLKTHKIQHFSNEPFYAFFWFPSFQTRDLRKDLSIHDHLRIFFFLPFSISDYFLRPWTLGVEDALWISVAPFYGNLSHRQCFKKWWVLTETKSLWAF